MARPTIRSPAALFALLLLCRSGTAQTIEAHFSPQGGCTEAIVRELGAAKTSVLVQAYSFTSSPIAKALLEAHKRGVKVEVILDRSQRTERYSEADFLANAGIPVRIDAKHAIAHNKVMVIDAAVTITGSFNFTRAAEEGNAENLLVIRDAALAERFAANWHAHAGHSEPYAREKGFSSAAPLAAAGSQSPATAGEARQGGFVASSRSAVFHRADCKFADRIAAKNLVHYATREEAVKAGKRPCKECQP